MEDVSKGKGVRKIQRRDFLKLSRIQRVQGEA